MLADQSGMTRTISIGKRMSASPRHHLSQSRNRARRTWDSKFWTIVGVGGSRESPPSPDHSCGGQNGKKEGNGLKE